MGRMNGNIIFLSIKPDYTEKTTALGHHAIISVANVQEDCLFLNVSKPRLQLLA